jgi:hypothetical protein
VSEGGLDDALAAERFALLLQVDGIERQLRDLARSQANLTCSRDTLVFRLDQIAAEFKGRAAARQAAADAPKDIA